MSNTPREGNSGSRVYSPPGPSTMPQPSPRKQKNESPPVPDSTTEPPPVQIQDIQEGDDVFFRTDNMQQVLGTVGQILGQRCQILFGDGTEQWASFKRVKKMSTFLEEEKNKSQCNSKAAKRVPNVDSVTPPTPTRPQPVEFSCASCGVTRKISAKKAKAFEGDSDRMFQCRKCVNQTDSSPHSIANMPTSRNTNSMGPYMISSSALQAKLPPDISIIPMGKCSSFSLPSTSAGHSSKGFTKSPTSSGDGLITIPRQIQFSVLPATSPPITCFNCNKPATPYDRVYCTLCHSACHLSCLTFTPSPLSGDKFWDVLCSPCGNQKTSSGKTGVFSYRRSITSWSDVAHLLISCLSVSSGQRMFDLDTEIMTFLANNSDRLYLPRQYKSATAETQQKCLLNALNTSRMRFVNGREVKKKTTLWALRADTPMASISYNHEKKKLINNIALGMGLKPSVLKISDKALNTANLSSKVKFVPSKPVPEVSLSVQNTATSPTPLTEGSDNGCSPESTTSSASEKSQSSVLGKQSFTMVKKTPEAEISNQGPIKTTSPVQTNSRTQQNQESTSGKKSSMKRKRGSSCDNEAGPSKVANVMEIQSSQNTATKDVGSKGGRKRTSSKSMGSPSPKKPGISTKTRDSPGVTTVHIPLPKKIKLEKRRINTEKYVVKTSESEPLKSKLIRSDESTTESGNEVNEITPRAIKSAALVPPPAPQVLLELKTSAKLSPTARTGKPGRPRNSSLASARAPQRNSVKLEKSPLISRLRTRGRGRPLGSKAQPKMTGTGLKNINLKLTLRPNGITVSKSSSNGAPLTVSRRVGAFHSISERRPSQLLPQNTEPSTNTISVISSSLLDAAIFGEYRMECLPRSPQTEADCKTEALKVFAHLRAERENEVAALLLSRSETETRCQTRRKAELFVGRQKRDLNDFDSYEVIAKRVDADGLTRYQVLWKGHGLDYEDDESDEEMTVDTRFSPHSATKIVMMSSPKRKVSIHDEEELRRVVLESKPKPVLRKSVNPHFLIDLTDDSP